MAATPPQHSNYGSPPHQQQQQQQQVPEHYRQPQHVTTGSVHSVESATMMHQRDGHDVRVVGGYILGERLGHGSFATVFKGVRVAPGDAAATSTTDGTAAATTAAEHVAIKAIARNERLSKKVLENLEAEISILRNHRHPNVAGLIDVRRTPGHFYLLLEYCGGGDLQRLIRTRKLGRLSERLTRRLVRDLTAGLRFLHDRGLMHRDIKPQNLLLTGPLPLDELEDLGKTDEEEGARRRADYPSCQFALKIADFGFARHLQTASLAETLCGSPLYMAPEILQHQRYDAKADLWSAGTVLFEMVSGRPPFHGENHIDLLRNIQRRAVRLPPGVRVSQECVALLRLLLNRNPLGRGGFDEFFAASDAFVALGCNGDGSGIGGLGGVATETAADGGGGSGTVAETAAATGGDGGSAAGVGGGGGPTVERSLGLGKIAETSDESDAAAEGGEAGSVDGCDATMAASLPTASHESGGVEEAAANGTQPRTGSAESIPAAAEAPTTTSMVPSPHANRYGRRHLDANHVNLVAPDGHGLGPAHHVAPSCPPPHPANAYRRDGGNMQVVQGGGPSRGQHRQQPPTSHFAPLVPSPPGPMALRGAGPAPVPPPFSLDGGGGGRSQMSPHQLQRPQHQQQQLQQQRDPVPAASHLHPQHVQQQQQQQQRQQQQHRLSSMSNSSSQGSSSGDEFVMVEHNHMQQSSYSSSAAAAAAVAPSFQQQQYGAPVPPPPPSPQQHQPQRRSFSTSVRNAIASASSAAAPSLYGGGASTCGSAVMVGGAGASPRHGRGHRNRGMLSTSPGTGGALMGAMMGPPQTRKQLQQQHQQGGELELLAKMLAAAEDVGRRAVNVAHLGDTRAYIAMRIVVVGGSGAVVGGTSSSVLSSMMPMEGIEEERGDDDHAANGGEFGGGAAVDVLNRRHLARSTARVKTADGHDEDDGDDEMPFALAPDDSSAADEDAGDKMGVVQVPHISPSPSRAGPPTEGPPPHESQRSTNMMVHAHFREALSCYLKALPLMRGAVTAAQRVTDAIASMSPPAPPRAHSHASRAGRDDDDHAALAGRCEVSLRWLAAQFNGVLERADAANAEIEKLASQMLARKEVEAKVVTVEELIYNHSLACGRDGAVKQLLGQYDAARVCYKSAGLLAETLLMEPRLGGDDRKILEGYVSGFAERITEVERIQHGGHDGARGSGGSGVVSIVGGVVPHESSFRLDNPSTRAAAATQPAPLFRNEAHNLTFQ